MPIELTIGIIVMSIACIIVTAKLAHDWIKDEE
jgi:hypothetical protein